MTHTALHQDAISLLQQLIGIQSFSSEEDKTGDTIQQWLEAKNVHCHRQGNNIYAYNKHFDKTKPCLLLNSHHDTVKPNSAYTRDPYTADIEDGKLYGLGSNDAGGCLVSLLTTFVHFYEKTDLQHNIIIVASAEEESSGQNGLNSVLPNLPDIDVAIVGEPTLMQLAVSEKGLVVFDATVKGTPSHAAHPNENNAIYNSIKVLEWCQNFKFPKVSESLGEVKMTVTQISAGKQHNVVPAHVDFVVDVRVNDCYTNQEIYDLLTQESPFDTLKPRSLRLSSSSIPMTHSLVKIGQNIGRETYGSPTLSDQSVLSCQSLKLGPGDSTRSHSADEFIYVDEIKEGIDLYIQILEQFLMG